MLPLLFCRPFGTFYLRRFCVLKVLFSAFKDNNEFIVGYEAKLSESTLRENESISSAHDCCYFWIPMDGAGLGQIMGLVMFGDFC